MEKEWTKIHISKNANLINLLVDILKNEGIHAVAIDQIDSSYTTFGDIAIYVNNRDIESSKKIINLYNERNS